MKKSGKKKPPMVPKPIKTMQMAAKMKGAKKAACK